MDQGEANFQTAKQILTLLKIGVNDQALLEGLKSACEDCGKVGPRQGKQCASLRLFKEIGGTYEPPEWCRDPEIKKKRSKCD